MNITNSKRTPPSNPAKNPIHPLITAAKIKQIKI
jgi:hypothetical protein